MAVLRASEYTIKIGSRIIPNPLFEDLDGDILVVLCKPRDHNVYTVGVGGNLTAYLPGEVCHFRYLIYDELTEHEKFLLALGATLQG